jgi:hypothetical protein
MHHEPSQGGAAATARYRAQYEETLRVYTDCFGPPPAHIWGSAAQRFAAHRRYVSVPHYELADLMDKAAAFEDDFDPGCG